MNCYYPLDTLAMCLSHAAYDAFPEYTYKDRDWGKHDKWRSTLTREERKTAVAPADCYIEKTRKHSLNDITVYSMFIQTWGSTALGFGGIGGQAITSAYVVVIESSLLGVFAVYFGGRFAYKIDRPSERFFADVSNFKMLDVKDVGKNYERTN